MMSKKNNDKWSITEKRFIAYFDILGFKDRVMRDEHEAIYEALASIDENTLHSFLETQEARNLFLDSGICITKFSDSIALFSKKDTVEDFILFLISTRFLFSSFLKAGFLMKGGMAYGNISLDKNKQLYFGQPIIDACLLQEEVDYIGVVAHNSIEEFQQKIGKTNKKFYTASTQLLFEGKSPLKKSGLVTHLNLNWFPHLANKESNNNDTKKDIIAALKKYYLNVSGSPRRYIDNTIDFINKNKEIYLDSVSLPSE